jgi:hypothetical protein
MGRLSSENSLMISSLKGSREVTSGRPRFFGNATVVLYLGCLHRWPSLSLEVADMVDDIVLIHPYGSGDTMEHCGGVLKCLCSPP